MRKTQIWPIVAGVAGAVLVLPVLLYLALRPSPATALTAFYNRNRVPEETLTDPLIVAGDRVVPLVISEVANKSMPNRGYAIVFLGEGRHRAALPILSRIVQDEGERAHDRGAALEAVWRIDEAEGRRLAGRYTGHKDHLGYQAVALLGGEVAFEPQRTVLQAALGWLDP